MNEKSYKAGIYDKRLAGRRISGELWIQWTGPTFHGKGQSISLPLDQLNVRVGGAGNRLVFFTHPSQPDVTLHTPDRSVLHDKILLEHRETQAQIREIRHSRMAGTGIKLGILLAIVLVGWGAFAARGPVAHAVTRRIPPEMEEKLGESAFAQITIDRRLIQDPEIQAQLKELVAPLVEVLPEDRFLFKFHIVEDSSLNAFAMPGGFVVLHSGLLLKSDRAEEVLGVLAHEIAHVTRQHTLRNIIESASLYFIVQTFFGDLSGLAAVLADSGAFILQQKFSRTFEEEADKEGLRYLVQARIDPTGFIDFFHKIKEEQDRTILGKATSNLTWLSTHPATEDRILNLKNRIDNLQLQEEFPSLKIHYKKFQADLRRHLQE